MRRRPQLWKKIGVSKHQWDRMAHAECEAASLWWYCLYSRKHLNPNGYKRSRRIIKKYLRQNARGGGNVTKGTLRFWLEDLKQHVQITARRKRYWTLPCYARAHGEPIRGFQKRFQRMEEIAIRLYPYEVPPGRKRELSLLKITEAQRREIESLYDEYAPNLSLAHIIKKFGIPPFRAGQIASEFRRPKKIKRFPRK